MPRPRKLLDMRCTTCQTSFNRREHYQRHLRSHTEEKPFSCVYCQQIFSRGDSLARHYTSVHQTDTGKPLAKRRRVIKACESCRLSKVRCDGKEPCQRCCDQHRECSYLVSKRTGQSATRTGQLPRGHCLNLPSRQDQAGSQPTNTSLSINVVSQAYPQSQKLYEQAPVHSPAQADAAYGAIDTITVPPFFSLDWNDFDEWLNFGFDDEYMGLSAPAASATAAITGLYGNIQEPDMDKDAIDPRQYYPASIELDAQLVFPDMATIASEDIEKENLALVEQVPDGTPRKVFEMATVLQTKSNYPKFIELRIPPARVLNAWVQLYFEHFHPVFPILHKPTFCPARMNPFLVLTVAAIGAHFSDLEGSQACYKAMHELIRRYTSYTVRLHLKTTSVSSNTVG
ncbi:C2H2 type zinc finger domain protein [Aspergillus fischeri NRRL 181]|uniref:C2H2 type zinc finger domain protein n=1 Tax=Neosartorya fischeri (strain ATCC 1020 / DSM 3700 / CBS 544.65 / FGSC A1164 / JCM 1740 / NRRL 181 / WB 181) TaxID=331117 RepID=A1DCW2_NEOFI|nr:C2H2 type zinc finger domain protein [Aspergillus fischeri NRRL 181]EAW19672.1 C2H2 type zinc finger domain protein [Aspergillus fischeri NRRL 181]